MKQELPHAELARSGISRGEYAYREIRQRLLDGRWKPGDVLSTYGMAEELAISRTPITGAIKRLEAEGFLQIVPQVGCVVRGPTPQQVEEAFLIRASLEGLAAEVAAGKLTEDAAMSLHQNVAATETAVLQRDTATFQELNKAFHHDIVMVAALPTLEQMISGMWQRHEYELGTLAYFHTRLDESLRDHRDILQRLCARDASGARAAMEDHVRRGGQAYAAYMRQYQATETSREE